MNRKDAILKLRESLAKRRDELRKALAGDLALLTIQNHGDVVDGALDCAKDEISSQLAEVESRELAGIELALERMRKSTYGICEDCKASIPMARLNALPCAVRCIKCQRSAELRGESGFPQVNWGRLLDEPDMNEDLQALGLA